jgi:N-methylhydantoinase A
MAFGGAGPLHGNSIGKLLGSWPVIIPPSPGVLNAYGDVMTSHREEAGRTLIRSLASLTEDELAEAFGGLEQTATERLTAQGLHAADLTYAYRADVRYHGQGFELTIEVDPAQLTGGEGRLAISSAFDAEHERLFSFLLDADHELVSITVTASGPVTEIPLIELEPSTGDISAALLGTTSIWVDGGQHEAALVDRPSLRAGDIVTGPAIVVEMDSTALVLPGHIATVDPSGCLLIEPVKE